MLLYDMQSHHCSEAGLCLKVKDALSRNIRSTSIIYCVEKNTFHIYMNGEVFQVSEIQSLLFICDPIQIYLNPQSVYWISHLKSNYFGFISYKCQGLKKWSKTVYWQREQHINQKFVGIKFT